MNSNGTSTRLASLAALADRAASARVNALRRRRGVERQRELAEVARRFQTKLAVRSSRRLTQCRLQVVQVECRAGSGCLVSTLISVNTPQRGAAAGDADQPAGRLAR